MGVTHPNESRVAVFEGDSFRIAYRFLPGHPAVVFLHGLSASREYFDSAFQSELARYYGLVALDIPGFGESSTSDGDYDLTKQAERIRAVIMSLQLQDVILVGHSHSGPVTLLVTGLLPSLVRRIILVEGSITATHGWAPRIASQSLADYRVTFAEEQKNSYSHFEAELVKKEPACIAAMQKAFAKTTPEAMHGSAVSLVEYCSSVDLVQAFGALSIPVVYLLGEGNREELVENEQIRKLPEEGVHVQLQPGGHCLMFDDPARFYHTILKLCGVPASY